MGFAGIEVKGDYIAGTLYNERDYVVSAQGNGFVARVNGVLDPPPEDFVSNDEWAAFVAAGAPGEQGIAGMEGPIGPTGPEGPAGPQGVAGADGQIGPTGPEGPRGPEGTQGQQGIQGPTGPEGPRGEQGVQGEPGPAGPGGATGPTGPSGNAGPTGPTGPSYMEVYRANLSTAGSALEIPLGNAINYRVAYASGSELSLSLRALPTLTQAHCDYRIVSQYNDAIGVSYWNAFEGNNAQFTPTSAAIDTQIYNNTREMHRTWLRIQDPDNSSLWSTYEVNLFSSQNGARVIVWVFVIDEGGSY